MSNLHLTEKQRFWLDHVEACGAAGISMKSYAEKNGLDLHQFYLWKGRLKKLGFVAGRGADASAESVRVMQSPKAVSSSSFGLRIELGNGICIQVPDDCDVDVLCTLVRHAASVFRL